MMSTMGFATTNPDELPDPSQSRWPAIPVVEPSANRIARLERAAETVQGIAASTLKRCEVLTARVGELERERQFMLRDFSALAARVAELERHRSGK